MHILFYNDSSGFGGHEVMALCAVEYLARKTDHTITYIAAEANSRLIERLNAITVEFPSLRVIRTPVVSRSLQCVRTLFDKSTIVLIAEKMRSLNPDVAIIVQGTIEVSSLGIYAAKRAAIPAIGYIPFGHTMRRMGAALWPLRDIVDRQHYSAPDAFITISESMKQTLGDRGVSKPIEIATNCVDFSLMAPVSKSDVREALGLPIERRIVAVVGRVQFVQKAQDVWLRAVAAHRSKLPEDVTFAMIGDGPDYAKMLKLIDDLKLGGIVQCLPWVNDSGKIYSAIDLLAIPSHFEGVPLVMLEAMYAGLPIIASNCDGMSEMLPKSWLFDLSDPCEVIATLLKQLNTPDRPGIEKNRVRAQNEFSLNDMGRRFEAAMLSALGAIAP